MIFETGYGPSGLPHIGTFGEVARTSMVRHAFEVLTEGKRKTRLICFSDDMDGLRKVPDNVPNKDMLAAYLDKPLTSVPDPFSNEYPSFAAHNNARLRRFLDRFGFEYEFFSATECYKSGRFDETLLAHAQGLRQGDGHHPADAGARAPRHLLAVPADLPAHRQGAAGADGRAPSEEGHDRLRRSRDRQEGRDAGDGRRASSASGRPTGRMRWTALGVDYEMAGKDLIDSVTLSSRICKALGGTPPEGFNYELFLDDKGEKISKSKGNGLTIEEWLTYASPREPVAVHVPEAARAPRSSTST